MSTGTLVLGKRIGTNPCIFRTSGFGGHHHTGSGDILKCGVGVRYGMPGTPVYPEPPVAFLVMNVGEPTILVIEVNAIAQVGWRSRYIGTGKPAAGVVAIICWFLYL